MRPIGVPVVLPSKTPDRMRTVSGSRRWLVNCEVPGRRRSTSACRSACASAKPGGQPSTTQPNAGPWLSPKLVTVKILPKLLPATRILQIGCPQLFRPQQKHASAAHFDRRPNERQPRKSPQQCALGVADFHD